ncbi:MAG: ABC transporter ATP-binding protein [Bacteroidota bacterium]
MEPTIKVENLTKIFNNRKAIDNLSFSVQKGEIFGLVGPDGSGKTTLIKLLAGIIQPTEGEIVINGLDIQKDYKKIKPLIGYLSQNFSHYLDLTVEENLEFFAEMHKIKNYRDRIEFLLRFVNLENFRNTLIANLSGGMKQKLALISSLIYEPEILLLDEPTTGVDPISRREFWFLLHKLVLEGKTIFFATPYLDEAERFNKVLLLDSGKKLACDSPSNLLANVDFSVLEIICSNLNTASKILKEYGDVQVFGDRIHLVLPKQKRNLIEEVKKSIESAGVELYQIQEINPTLENVFFHLITKRNQ